MASKPGTVGHSGARVRAGLVAAMLAAAVQSQGADTHPLFRDAIEQYPQPVPVNQIEVNPTLAPDPRVAELFARPTSARTARNEAIALRVTGMDFPDHYPGLEKAEGQQFLVLDTEWRNLQAPQGIARSSAEGKADRTMGVGSLSAGNNAAQPRTILADVAYKVSRLGDHVFLLANGYALDLRGGSSNPSESLVIARPGEARDVELVFAVESAVESLALHFFDYRQGHIRIDLAGDPEPSRPRQIQRLAGVVELEATTEAAKPFWGEQSAPTGWEFQPLRLKGRSLARSGTVQSILQLNTATDFWLEIDGGHLLAPTPATGINPEWLRFTPEFFQQRELVFLVPTGTQGSRLGLRLGNGVMRIETGSAPATVPPALAEYQDGNTMRIRIFGLRQTAGAVTLDIGVEPLVEGRGLEITPARQFALVIKEQRLSPDMDLTSNQAFGAGEILVAPPGTMVRFELAFATDQAAEALYLRGFQGETEISLNGLPVTATKEAPLAGTPLAGCLGQPRGMSTAPVWAGQAAPVTVSKPDRPDRHRKQREASPPPPPVLLPPAETTGLPRETEPNDSFDEANLVSEGLAISGFLKQGDRDFISFALEGPPQIWAVEAIGTGLREMAYHENSGKYSLRRASPSGGEGPVSMTHLHLLPGRHTIGLIGRGEGDAEYTLRMVPLGSPDPSREREPNDLEDQANLVLIGATRYGWLHDRGDKDLYRFSLQAESRLRLSVKPPLQNRISAQLGRLARFESPDVGQDAIHEGVFGPGDYVLELKDRLNQHSNEPYALEIERLNPYGEDSGGAITLEFSQAPPIPAAFRARAQQLTVPLRVKNRSAQPRQLTLAARSSHWGWRAQPAEPELELAANEVREVDLTVDIMPDAWADHVVQLFVQATSTGSNEQSLAELNLEAACEAPLISPRQDFPIPDALRGGFNLAWSAFGSEALSEDAWRQADLYDGITPNDKAWSVGVSSKDFPYEVTVKLAGNGQVPVAGVQLNPQGSCEPGEVPNEFEVLLSSDGAEFTLAATGTLSPIRREQSWLLEQPVTASHARLRILSNHGGNRGRLCLGEFKVVADPAFNPWPGKRLNLGLPGYGGHVAWSKPLITAHHAMGLLSEEAESPSWRVDHLNSNEFVVGLHHGRAALIRELQWLPVDKSGHAHPGWIQVFASMDGPIGPWKPLGRWELGGGPSQPRVFSLEEDTWVRFLRFSTTEPEKPGNWYWYLPETLGIIEAVHDGEYHSILSEWGHYERAAQYELERGAKLAFSTRPAGAVTSPEQVQTVQPDVRYDGRVSRGERVERYALTVPDGHNTLELTLHQGEAERLDLSLTDEKERAVDLSSHSVASGETLYSATVEGGDRYRLRVSESQRSIIIAWDNSGSVNPYKSLLYQSLGEFADDVAAGVEYVNFVPFQEPPASLLTDQWLDQPTALQTILNDYDRTDASSNTESNALRAAIELGQRDGSRAMILLTDAASTGYKDRSRMWASLQETRPRIFALELHSGIAANVPQQQDLMQDLAMAQKGHYSYFSSQSDLDLGFRRASCMLRRPVEYTLSAQTRSVRPPEPGAIEVELNATATASAIEIIFDASGSMWARLDGVPRIQIAREVLVDLVNNTLPRGATVALRVFGNREAQSCRTDLEIEPGPLDRDALIGFIQDIQPQDRSRTPLADSLRQVEKDLGKIEGAKLLILLTDGEESCDGDPDAAIAELKELGMDIRLNIVGLAIDDEALKSSFARWAKSGGGLYFNAASREQLGAALSEAMLPKVQVLDATETVIAEGTVGAEAIPVPPGRYRVRVLTVPPLEFSDVGVAEATVTRLSDQPQ
ncbi:MAG: VWA domain-containing protein [Xanthomonadales bacterium]|nr:VWA domain-containing protein [Xanthomonadales bacterium]